MPAITFVTEINVINIIKMKFFLLCIQIAVPQEVRGDAMAKKIYKHIIVFYAFYS